MAQNMRTDAVEHLLDAFVALDSADEVYAFLLDVCTIREMQDMSQRLSVAHMLEEGQSYIAIQEATGASATTISRVSKALNYGADGYRNVLDKIEFD
jgi:TrpR-related protein YerC/YecD